MALSECERLRWMGESDVRRLLGRAPPRCDAEPRDAELGWHGLTDLRPQAQAQAQAADGPARFRVCFVPVELLKHDQMGADSHAKFTTATRLNACFGSAAGGGLGDAASVADAPGPPAVGRGCRDTVRNVLKGGRQKPPPDCVVCGADMGAQTERSRKSWRCAPCDKHMKKRAVLLHDAAADLYALALSCHKCTPRQCLRDASFFFYKPHSRRSYLSVLTRCKAHEPHAEPDAPDL